MASDIVWLDQAKDDVRELPTFMETKSPSAAERYVEGLYSACKRLATFPLSGRRYNDMFRVLVFRNHLVFYWYDQMIDLVSIAMVIDGRRDLKALLDRRTNQPPH